MDTILLLLVIVTAIAAMWSIQKDHASYPDRQTAWEKAHPDEIYEPHYRRKQRHARWKANLARVVGRKEDEQ